MKFVRFINWMRQNVYMKKKTHKAWAWKFGKSLKTKKPKVSIFFFAVFFFSFFVFPVGSTIELHETSIPI